MTSKDAVLIRIKKGSEVTELVNPFYKLHGSQSEARNDDLFFLALQDEKLIGCVRYCIEEKTPMLRSMMISEVHRRQGIGRDLLSAFENYLELQKIKNAFCLPFAHLQGFYSQIGFQIAKESEIPPFLKERLKTYQSRGGNYLCMKRA